jgi:hypothetical protein
MAHTTVISKDAFTFSHVLLAQVSNESRHPRATVPELRAILRPSNTADHQLDNHVGHWWEAQLLHYGLRPSKTKAVAKTRLLDALNQGTLEVPRDIAKIEAELKKQWAKKERETKAELKKAQSGTSKKTTATPVAPGASTKGSKRKAQQDGAAAASAPKKKTKAAEKQPKVFKPKTGSAKATSSNAKASSFRENNATQSSARTTNHPGPKQTARRSGGFLPPGRGAVIATASSTTGTPPRPKQTARRGGGCPLFKREAYDDDDDAEFFSDEDQTLGSYDEDEDNEDDEPSVEYVIPMYNVPAQTPPRSQPLGLLNGRYEITCPDLEDWGYSSPDFSLILTLDGTYLWGAYDFGMFNGILHLPTRPYDASGERLEFTWRGRENGEGETSYGAGNDGWLEFFGGGRISGMISCYGDALFEGQRVSGNQTRSERDARSMRDEWDGYNQENYDRANRARWGGSSW